MQTVTAKPGDGKPISILTQTYSPVTPQPPTNTAWANLNEQLGSDLEIQQIPQAEYVNKFSTALAGGQLPDMFFIAEVADMPAMVEATCLDLSDHLCNGSTCPGVIGNVLVYRDGRHLTATYARTMTPYIERGILAALDTTSVASHDETPH